MYLDGILVNSGHLDSAVDNGTAYYYVITAMDTTGNENAGSAEVMAIPQVSAGPTTSHA